MIRKFYIILTFIILSQIVQPVYCQVNEDVLGNWIMYFGQNSINDKWSLHTEIQWRNHRIEPNLEQLLLRTGINYHIEKDYMATVGYGYISTHPENKDSIRTLSNEHRIWQQFIIKNQLNKLNFEHRYRFEERWVNDDFRLRARYRIMLTFPFNTKAIEKGSIFLALYDEIFLHIDEAHVFDRNRLYAALAYQLSKISNVQMGILNQYLLTSSKYYFQLAVFVNPDLRNL